MRNKFDYIGKLIVAAGTTTPERVQKEFSILSEEQSADCYVIESEAIDTASIADETLDLHTLHRPFTRIGPRGVALPRGW